MVAGKEKSWPEGTALLSRIEDFQRNQRKKRRKREAKVSGTPGNGAHFLSWEGWNHQRRALSAQPRERKFLFWRLSRSFPSPLPHTVLNCQCIAEVNYPPYTRILIAPSEERPDNLSSWKAVSIFSSFAVATGASASRRGSGVHHLARPAALAICCTL